ncbi:leucyl/phenylalanyl-tRNA--protein transferase [Sulfurospirillum barnesii]|uniref:leucyl/phenylalanyl-tRNA--protein transferase n=1 Tax=Sulfurospirillum barnesii TaxID=44674 RepID=UPI0012E998CB|nr:leucyl/phenylalanyl-tRNA--protein transferase [Sulfurospirillum barnesii]
MATKILIPQLHPKDYEFPSPLDASDEGLLAWGGDLAPERLLRAYSEGIFPWFNEDDPLLWWSPNPRLILFPDAIKQSKSLLKSMKHFDIRYDTCFERVMRSCWQTRLAKGQKSWINEALIESFCALHVKGFAHSVETFFEGNLVGGLYGLYLGGMFCGESMFSIKTDASKSALVGLCRKVKSLGGDFIDCQLPTEHLKSLGAIERSREVFLKMTQETLNKNGLKEGTW